MTELSDPDFWNERYTRSDGENPTHEWFKTFAALEPYFEKHLFAARPADASPRIMHLGSGDSVSAPSPFRSQLPAFRCSPSHVLPQTVPADLAKRGYKNQLCLDFSAVVVELMSARHAALGGIEWRQADVRDMPEIPDASVDVAFDKGTMDAMIHGSPWSPPDDVTENTAKYLKEVRSSSSPLHPPC